MSDPVDTALSNLKEITVQFVSEYKNLKAELTKLSLQLENLNSGNNSLTLEKTECARNLEEQIQNLDVCNEAKSRLEISIQELNISHQSEIERIKTQNTDKLESINKTIIALTNLIEGRNTDLITGGNVKSLKPPPSKPLNKKISNPHISNFLNNF